MATTVIEKNKGWVVFGVIVLIVGILYWGYTKRGWFGGKPANS